MKHFILPMLFVILSLGCNNSNSDRTRYFRESADKTIDIRDQVVSVKTDILFRFGDFLIVDTLLVYTDFASVNPEVIHIFNKRSFEYITSTGISGRGPGEITGVGCGYLDLDGKVLWVDDHGNQVKWKFPIDSILSNSNFLPSTKIEMNNEFFMTDGGFISDSVVLGVAVVPLSNSSMEMTMAKENLYSGEIEKFGYVYPGAKDRYDTYFNFCLSLRDSLYVHCYKYVDLMTICDLNGNLIVNVEGSSFNKRDKTVNYFIGVDIYKNYIIASYIGDRYVILDGGNEPQIISPSKFLVFDMDGNYLKTLKVGSQFSSFCVDEDNDRIVLFFEEKEDSFGYFSLKDIDFS